MSGPITWRNVQGRGFSDAAQLLRGASDSINRASDNFQGALDDREDQLQTVATQEREANTDEYLNALRNYDSVEALEAGRGELEQVAAGLGGNVDQDVLRDGFDQRLNSLRTSTTAENDFERSQARAEADPIAEQYRQLKLNNDDEGAAELLENNSDLLGRAGLLAELTGYGDNRDRTELERERADAAKAEADALKKANKGFDSLLAEARNAPSEYDARRMIRDKAEEYGVSPSVLLAREEEISQSWESANELSGAAKEELSNYSVVVNNNADAIEAQAKADRQKVFAENAVDENVGWSDAVTLADVTEAAKNNEWDETSAWLGTDDLSDTITKAVDEWVAETGLSGEERTLAPAFAKRAIEEMGVPYEMFGKENLELGDLKAAMGRAYTEYENFNFRKRKRLEAEKAYEKRLNQALALRNSVSSYKNVLKGNAAAALNGE